MLRPGQMNTSIYVELGNGDTFIFDFGEGAVTNYLASGILINKLNDIFISHLHVDYIGSLPWTYGSPEASSSSPQSVRSCMTPTVSGRT